jgi:hypothetical protein
VRECQSGIDACGAATGLVLQFDFLDFVSDTFGLIGQTFLDSSHQQLLLELSHDSSTNTILGSYAYVDGGVPGSLTTFANTAFTSGTTNNLFSAESWTRAGFEAFDPVPEPSSLLLLGTSIMALGALAWKRHRRP